MPVRALLLSDSGHNRTRPGPSQRRCGRRAGSVADDVLLRFFPEDRRPDGTAFLDRLAAEPVTRNLRSRARRRGGRRSLRTGRAPGRLALGGLGALGIALRRRHSDRAAAVFYALAGAAVTKRVARVARYFHTLIAIGALTATTLERAYPFLQIANGVNRSQ